MLFRALIFFILSFQALGFEAKVIALHGRVLRDFDPIAKGLYLKADDVVTSVDEESWVKLQFPDGTVVVVNNGSLWLKDIKKDAIALKLIRGKMSVESSSNSEVITRFGRIKGSGTHFMVDEDHERSVIVVRKGKANISNFDIDIELSNDEETRLAPHQPLLKNKFSDITKVSFKELEGLHPITPPASLNIVH